MIKESIPFADLTLVPRLAKEPDVKIQGMTEIPVIFRGNMETTLMYPSYSF